MSLFLWLFLAHPVTAGLPCSGALDRQLDTWSATGEVLTAPGGPAGGAVYRIATDAIGVWITLHQPRGLDVISLFRTTPKETMRLDFGPACEPTRSNVPSPTRPDAFSDEDLSALLARDGRLIVYLWSPHLPLSVDGYAEIVSASETLGVPLIAVVDGAANRDYVQEVSDKRGIPPEARKPLGSVELLFRDLAVHTPTTLVFADGTVGAPLPGYRNRAAYVAALSPMLRRR